ncbi:phytoene desaturase family protein [Bacillus sp. 2205SS5-2]|uniref:phytoene desaturase family protein n=1 Tax=Bacillus sp. 2205SS5-2 TaxID=3109031 RepID=UPI003003C212
MKKILIVGAGLGGLAAGITLQHKGYQVEIIEQNAHAGGKMMPVEIDGYSFDYGPNTITMPRVFQNVVAETGENPDDYFSFLKLNAHTVNQWEDGTIFQQTTDVANMLAQFEELDEKGSRAYPDYLAEVERIYKEAELSFFYAPFTSWKDYLSLRLGFALMKVRPFEKLAHFHERYFSNEKILMTFNRYATYIGSSPYQCPATFSLIGHLEMNEGVYYTIGGNTNIAKGFLKLFQKLGGKVTFDTKVEKILLKNKKAYGLLLSNGEKRVAAEIIINGDFITASKKLLTEAERPSLTDEKLDAYEPSISAFVILAGLNQRQEQVHHHHVFFTGDYHSEFEDIFLHHKLPDDPTIYVSHSVKTDPERSKGSNFFILVNAPAIEMNEKQISAYKEKVYDKLERMGVPIRQYLEVEKIYPPQFIRDTFSAYKGALYGVSSHSMKDSFLRPFNQSRDIENLYYVGGTTHPGGGSPMVTISGVNVAKRIVLKDHKQTTKERSKIDE